MIQTTKTAKINSQHWHHLIAERGLDPAWVTANVLSLTQQEASERLYLSARSSGIWLEGANGQGQFRPDQPWADQQGKKAPKYRTPYQDEYDAILPAHPHDPTYWKNLDKLKEQAYQIDGIPCLLLTEGMFKAIAGCSYNLPTVAVCGVEMGLTPGKLDPQGKRYVVPSLAKLAQAGFGFIFAYDADCARKKAVRQAELKLAHALEQFQVPVYSITGTWQEDAGKGMDDYIQNHGIEEFRQRLIAAERVREKYRQGDYGEKGSGKAPRPGVIGKALAEKYREHWVYCSELNAWLVYELEEKGVWSLVADDLICHLIQTEIKVKELETFITNSYINNIFGYLKRELFLQHWEEQSTRFLPFKNGVYELATGKLHDHAPGFRLTWKLPRDYSVIATEFSTIEEFLVQLSGGRQREYQILLYFMAAALRGRYDLQKFLYLIGSGGSGKSTYMQLITMLVGEKNTTTQSLEELEDKHNVIDLFGKRLLSLPDQSSVPTKKNSNFKRLTGGDYLSGRRLFKDTASFLFQGLALITSNPPFVFPASTANWLNRRLLLVECNNIVPKRDRDPQLLAKMAMELTALTNYLLAIPDETLTHVLQGIDEPDLTPATWEYQCQSDGLAAWINDELIPDPSAMARIGSDGNQWKGQDYDPYNSSLYASYCYYCRETGRTPKTSQTFSSDLIEITYRLLGWSVEKTRKRYAGKPQRVITGLRLRTENDEKIPTVAEKLEAVTTSDSPMTSQSDNLKTSQKLQQKPGLEIDDNRDNLNQEKTKISFKTSPLSVTISESAQNKEKLEVQNPNNTDEVVTAVTEKQNSHSQAVPGSHGPNTPVDTGGHRIDFSTYPARNSNDDRHKEKRATQCKEQMLACQTQEELERFKQNSGFSENEIKWVWKHLLTGLEQSKVYQSKNTSQKDLFQEKQLSFQEQQAIVKAYLEEHGECEQMVIAIQCGLPSAIMKQLLEPIAECHRHNQWEYYWKLKQ
ncbi:MAG: DUF3854 domain-containing protein [Cyanobacteria bacterium]|jgi:putative DNA primase/helicase|nr:DUF3854 domain-containing protein [Cyanobacteria bacterium GSL.Bin21]